MSRVVDGDGIPWVEVLHDDSCPWWRARGAEPFRQLRVVKLP